MNKVLVTGADGFIGSHLTELLLKSGYRVRALSYYNSFNNWGWLEDIPANPDLEVVTGDIRDPGFTRKIMTDIETVYHLAALIAIPFSYVAPDSYVDTNIRGTLNVCQAAKDLGKIRVLCTSTSEVYGTAQYVPIDEKHPKQPQSPYSATKIAADAIAMSFYCAFGLPVTIVRPFNTYGPRQSARAIIPTIITQLANNAKEIRLGDMTPTRDLNYVKDICRGFIALGSCDPAIGLEVNLSTGAEISISELFILIKGLMGSDARSLTDDQRIRPETSEVYRLLGDNSLIKKLTNWHPEYSLEQGLKETITWFTDRNNLSRYKANIYNI